MTARSAAPGRTDRATAGRFHGVFPSVPTACNKDGSIDEAGQRSVVRHCISEGADGIACLLFAGEFYKFSEGERKRVARAVVDEADGKLPVLVGISHSGTLPSIDLGKHAKSIGADGVIVTPPYHASFVTESRLSLMRHYSDLARSVELPIMIQDFESEGGVHLQAEQVGAIAERLDNVRYVKVEGNNQLERIGQIIRATRGEVGVFGGMAGSRMLEEMKAGIQGTIPGTVIVGRLVEAFDAQEGGDAKGAARIMRSVQPYLDFFVAHFDSFVSVEKESLKFKGVIANSTVREPAVALSERERSELHRVLRQIGTEVS